MKEKRLEAIKTIELANFYRKKKKYNKSIECYNKIYDLFISIIDNEKDSRLESINYWILSEIELAELYIEINEIDIAREIIERTKESCMASLKIDSSYVPILNRLANLDILEADIFKNRGEIKEEREFLLKAIKGYNFSLSLEQNNIEALTEKNLIKSKLAKNYFYDYTTETKALNLYRDAISDSTFILNLEPNNLDILENRAFDRVEIADIYNKQKQTTLALDSLNMAIEDYQYILSISSDNITVLNGLGRAYQDMASIYTKISDFDKVPSLLHQSIEVYQKVFDIDPKEIETINNITDSKIDLGIYYIEIGDIDRAVKILNEAIAESIESYNINSKGNFKALNNRALSIFNLAKIDVIQGKQRKAIEVFHEAIKYHTLALEINQIDNFTLKHRGIVYDMISEIYVDLRDTKMATIYYKKSLNDYNTSLKYYPNNPEAMVNKVKIISDYFFYNKKDIDKQESIEMLQKIISDCDKILKVNPNNHDAINNKLSVFSELSAIYDELGNESKTMEIAYQELEEYEKILKVYPRDSLILHNAGVGKFFLSEYLIKQKKEEEALFYLKSSIPNFDLALEVNQDDILTLTNKALSLRDIVRLSKDKKYSDDSIDTTYKLLDLYDEYFFSVEEESDTFHLIKKMLFPLSTILYSSLYSTILDKKLVLKAIEMVKAKTLKQMLSLAMSEESLTFDNQDKKEKFLIYREKIALLEREIRKITIIVNRNQEELNIIKRSKGATKRDIDILDKKQTKQLEIKTELYQELNLYKNRLSNLFLNRDVFIESNYQTALEYLDEESVVIYPFCYVYPDYYKRKHELYVVALYKRDGKIEIDIHFEIIDDPVIFSDYIYLTRELETILNLLENSQSITDKLENLNIKKTTVQKELLDEIFELDRDMNIISLKIDKSDFEWEYKYKIIQKALSFVQKLCLKSIPKNRKKIYFSPFGDLNLLPLHALSTPKNGYLIEQYEIVYIPFISILDTFHSNQEIDKNLFVSIDEFQEESETCKNIEGVGGEHKIDMSATEFKSKIHNNPYNILHLSTHGLSDLNNPLNSHLQFKNSDLSLLEIHALKLDINLVVLSACETNLSTINGADEVLAFERAFLIAGAKNIMTTFLSVDSELTLDFMTVFYKKMNETSSISSAFQRACVEDIDNGSNEWMLFRFTGV